MQITTDHPIDLKAAYDLINPAELYRNLGEITIPYKLIRLVNMKMQVSTNVVHVSSDMSNDFQVDRGIQEGDVFACLLFNLTEDNKTVRDAVIHVKP